VTQPAINGLQAQLACHSERSEESRFGLLKKKNQCGIPFASLKGVLRCAQNDSGAV